MLRVIYCGSTDFNFLRRFKPHPRNDCRNDTFAALRYKIARCVGYFVFFIFIF